MLFLESDYPYREEIFFRPFDSGLAASLWNYGRSKITSGNYSFHGLERGDRHFALLQYTISGKGSLNYDGMHFDLLPGSAIILTVPHNHRYYLPSDSDHWDFLYISMCGPEILRTWNTILERGGPIIEIPSSNNIWDAISAIFTLKSTNPQVSAFTLADLSYSFAMTLQEQVWNSTEIEQKRPQYIEKVIRYCLTHIHQNITVDYMAHIAGYSKYHFSRLFTEAEGISPASFLKGLRLKFAHDLLQTTKYSIKEIAFRCGFEDPGYFCKSYRKEYGSSPGKYRVKKAD